MMKSGNDIHDIFMEKLYDELEEYKHIYRNICYISDTLYDSLNPLHTTLTTTINTKKLQEYLSNFDKASEFEQKRFRIVITKVLKICGVEEPTQYFEDDSDYCQFISTMYLDKKAIEEGRGTNYMVKKLNAIYSDNATTIMS